MHILIVYYFYKSKISGVGDVIDSYSKELLKQRPNTKITVLCENVYNQKEKEIIDDIEIIRFNAPSILSGRIPLPSLDLWKKINIILKDKNIDQIHTHTRFSTPTLIALIASKKHKVQLIHFEHLSNFIIGEKWLLQTVCWLWDQTISRIIFNQTDKIVAISSSVKKFIVQQLGTNESKVIVIPNGVSIQPNPLSLISKFSNKKYFKLFFACRLVPLKNPILTLQAILVLSKIRQDFEFTIAGDGILAEEIKKFIIDNKLENLVKYIGAKTKNEVLKIYETNDIFLNPSYLEGLPGAVLEALLSNNICLVSNVGGNNDLITDSDCLLDLDKITPQIFANKIDFIMNNIQLVAKRTEIDKQKALKENTWQTAVSKMAKELEIS
jgi:glycosyltransferase involved in cell wall biosynthesis